MKTDYYRLAHVTLSLYVTHLGVVLVLEDYDRLVIVIGSVTVTVDVVDRNVDGNVKYGMKRRYYGFRDG